MSLEYVKDNFHYNRAGVMWYRMFDTGKWRVSVVLGVPTPPLGVGGNRFGVMVGDAVVDDFGTLHILNLH